MPEFSKKLYTYWRAQTSANTQVTICVLLRLHKRQAERGPKYKAQFSDGPAKLGKGWYSQSFKAWEISTLRAAPIPNIGQTTKLLFPKLSQAKSHNSSFGAEQGSLRLLRTQPHRKYQSDVHNSLLRTHQFAQAPKLPLYGIAWTVLLPFSWNSALYSLSSSKLDAICNLLKLIQHACFISIIKCTLHKFDARAPFLNCSVGNSRQ